MGDQVRWVTNQQKGFFYSDDVAIQVFDVEYHMVISKSYMQYLLLSSPQSKHLYFEKGVLFAYKVEGRKV